MEAVARCFGREDAPGCFWLAGGKGAGVNFWLAESLMVLG